MPQSSHATAAEQLLGHVHCSNSRDVKAARRSANQCHALSHHLHSSCQEAALLCLQYSPEPADAGSLLGCRVQMGASGQENDQGSIEVAAQHAVSQPPGQQGTVSPSTHARTRASPADLMCCTDIFQGLQSGRQSVCRQLLHLPCWNLTSFSAPAGFQTACRSLLQAPSADFNVRLLQLNGVAQQQQLVCRLCVRRNKLVLKAPGWMQHRAPFTRELQVPPVLQCPQPGSTTLWLAPQHLQQHFSL